MSRGATGIAPRAGGQDPGSPSGDVGDAEPDAANGSAETNPGRLVGEDPRDLSRAPRDHASPDR